MNCFHTSQQPAATQGVLSALRERKRREWDKTACVSRTSGRPAHSERGGPTRRTQRGEPNEGIAVQASASGRSDDRPECCARSLPTHLMQSTFQRGDFREFRGLRRLLHWESDRRRRPREDFSGETCNQRGGPVQWTDPPHALCNRGRRRTPHQPGIFVPATSA